MSDRSTRKREAILQAATELFLTREYVGTSMEDVAVAAAVSKQTVYKHFTDKQTLFREVALDSVQHVGRDFQSSGRRGCEGSRRAGRAPGSGAELRHCGHEPRAATPTPAGDS